MTPLLVLLHVLGACVWVGGHVVLVLVVLPRARKAGDARIVQDFEDGYEPIGMPALLLQVGTGVWLALRTKPAELGWLEVGTFPVSYLALKLALLLGILGLAIHAKLTVIPRLAAGELTAYGRHAWGVTLLSVALVVVGVGLSRGGWLPA